MGIDFNGVNGNSPVFGNNNIGSTKGNEKTYDFGFGSKEVDSTVGLDNTKFSTKPAFNSFDLDQMYAMAGISKPESVKPLETIFDNAMSCIVIARGKLGKDCKIRFLTAVHLPFFIVFE